MLWRRNFHKSGDWPSISRRSRSRFRARREDEEAVSEQTSGTLLGANFCFDLAVTVVTQSKAKHDLVSCLSAGTEETNVACVVGRYIIMRNFLKSREATRRSGRVPLNIVHPRVSGTGLKLKMCRDSCSPAFRPGFWRYWEL